MTRIDEIVDFVRALREEPFAFRGSCSGASFRPRPRPRSSDQRLVH
jgi:hypothetical protein